MFPRERSSWTASHPAVVNSRLKGQSKKIPLCQALYGLREVNKTLVYAFIIIDMMAVVQGLICQ